MAEYVMTQLEEIIEHVFSLLPMKNLHICACVCKKWSNVSRRAKRNRRQIRWLLHDSSKGSAEVSIKDRLHDIPCLPEYALVFCSSTLYDNKLAIPKGSHHQHGHRRLPRAAKLGCVTLEDYLQKHLPPSTRVTGVSIDGVIGQHRTLQPYEIENTEAASICLFPKLEGVEIYDFLITEEKLKKIGPFMLSTETPFPNPDRVAEVTGIPVHKNVKCILLFGTDPLMTSIDIDTDIGYVLLKRYNNVVISGGYVDNLIPEDGRSAGDRSVPTEEAIGLGVAFVGEDIKAASVMINRQVRQKAEIQKTLQKLKDCHVPQANRVAFMFTCIGRGENFYQQPNVESAVFRSLFPSVPLFGFFGNGEIGYNYLPDYLTPEGDSNMTLVGEYPDDESGHVWDLPAMDHSYTTIFTMLSLGKGH